MRKCAEPPWLPGAGVLTPVGSYGVVFKAIRNVENEGDDPDPHKQGKAQQYAIKRIFPTINASFILIEMLILRVLNGKKNITDLIYGYRQGGQVSLVFKY